MLVSAYALSLAMLLLGGGPDLERGSQPAAQSATPSSSTSPHEPAEPPATEICAGDPAPDFAFQGFDHRWMRLHHLLDQGPVPLVFAATKAELTRTDLERDDLFARRDSGGGAGPHGRRGAPPRRRDGPALHRAGRCPPGHRRPVQLQRRRPHAPRLLRDRHPRQGPRASARHSAGSGLPQSLCPRAWPGDSRSPLPASR